MVRSCWLLVATEARITDNKLWDKNKIDKETISYYFININTTHNQPYSHSLHFQCSSKMQNAESLEFQRQYHKQNQRLYIKERISLVKVTNSVTVSQS